MFAFRVGKGLIDLRPLQAMRAFCVVFAFLLVQWGSGQVLTVQPKADIFYSTPLVGSNVSPALMAHSSQSPASMASTLSIVCDCYTYTHTHRAVGLCRAPAHLSPSMDAKAMEQL